MKKRAELRAAYDGQRGGTAMTIDIAKKDGVKLLFPLLNIVACLFSSPTAVSSGQVGIWPVDFSMMGYEAVFNNALIANGFINSLKYMVLGTIVDLIVTLMAAYPLSCSDLIGRKPLMFAVGHWNSYFGALMYLRSSELFPLQLVLRQILVLNSFNITEMTSTMVDDMIQRQFLGNLLKYSVIEVASVPIMCLYPLIQKYFVKGVMLGSLKG